MRMASSINHFDDLELLSNLERAACLDDVCVPCRVGGDVGQHSPNLVSWSVDGDEGIRGENLTRLRLRKPDCAEHGQQNEAEDENLQTFHNRKLHADGERFGVFFFVGLLASQEGLKAAL